jgi:hypothetical protein
LDEEEKMETILETMVIGALFFLTMWLFAILGFISYPFVL